MAMRLLHIDPLLRHNPVIEPLHFETVIHLRSYDGKPLTTSHSNGLYNRLYAPVAKVVTHRVAFEITGEFKDETSNQTNGLQRYFLGLVER